MDQETKNHTLITLGIVLLVLVASGLSIFVERSRNAEVSNYKTPVTSTTTTLTK